jgi:antitoxin (DNA-binding transcriptional repressor) of toxin-antitoxin stability system
MEISNIQHVRSYLSQLLHKVAEGEEIIFAKAGKPVTPLTPFKQTRPRKPGALKRKIFVADDLDETPEEFLSYIE